MGDPMGVWWLIGGLAAAVSSPTLNQTEQGWKQGRQEARQAGLALSGSVFTGPQQQHWQWPTLQPTQPGDDRFIWLIDVSISLFISLSLFLSHCLSRLLSLSLALSLSLSPFLSVFLYLSFYIYCFSLFLPLSSAPFKDQKSGMEGCLHQTLFPHIQSLKDANFQQSCTVVLAH